jgi:hypothetical protein
MRSISSVSRPWIEQLHFSVELHRPGGSVEEVVARCAGILIAQAAYRAACTHYPERLVMLCRQAQIVARSDRDR